MGLDIIEFIGNMHLEQIGWLKILNSSFSSFVGSISKMHPSGPGGFLVWEGVPKLGHCPITFFKIPL
jgi:hypothetical protein